MDIIKIREERHKEDGGDWDDWPYPTITITSRVTGDLRTAILAKLDKVSGDVLIEESEVSGGWSEFTQETDYSVRVMVDGQERWRNDSEWSAENAMAAFLKWSGTLPAVPSPGLPPV